MVCNKEFAVWQQWAEPLLFASVMAINQVYMAVVHQSGFYQSNNLDKFDNFDK